MKITLLAYGSRGDVQPYAALALALKSRGHHVRLAAPENFKGFVEGFGLEYAPLAGDTRAMLENEKTLGHVLNNENIGFFNAVNREMEPIKARFCDDALEAAKGSELVVSSPITEFLAQSVAEAAKARCVLSYLAPQYPSSHSAPFGLPIRTFYLPFLNSIGHALFERAWWGFYDKGINEARKRWGLQPQNGSPTSAFRKKGGLTLLGFSPELVRRESDWPESVVLSGAWRMPESARDSQGGDHHDAGFVQWLEDGSPPIYFGFGSMPVPDHTEFLEMVAEVTEGMGMRALIGAGWTDISMQACDLPDNLAIVESADHGWLLPQCASAVHHGGAGTTHAGLSAGIPNVVASFFADQPYWGRQVRRLGVGDSFAFRDISPARLRQALELALEEGTAQRAAELGARMGAENGAIRACEAIEAWAKSA